MRRYSRYSNLPRTITVKFAGQCACCAAPITAGEIATYYPAFRSIAHVGGLEGNSPRCTAEIRKRNADPGYVDIDRLYEDQCANICGR